MIYAGSILAAAAFHVGILYGFAWLTGVDVEALAVGWIIGWVITKDAADIRRHAREARDD